MIIKSLIVFLLSIVENCNHDKDGYSLGHKKNLSVKVKWMAITEDHMIDVWIIWIEHMMQIYETL